MSIINITTSSELSSIIKNNKDIIINCGLTHCAPCKKIYPVFEQYAEKNDNITFCKITLDNCSERNDDYFREFLNLKKFPTFTLISNSNILDQFIGPDENKLNSLINSISGDEDF